jgi:hypothetical protein
MSISPRVRRDLDYYDNVWLPLLGALSRVTTWVYTLVMRRLSLHFVMFVLLLFAQQQSVAHQIFHASQHHSQQDPSRDNNKSCDKCLALAHLGDSIPASQLEFLVHHVLPTQRMAPEPVGSNSAFYAFRSRAPPAIS